MATITQAQIQAALSTAALANQDHATVSPMEAGTFNHYCTKLLIENQVFPLESNAQTGLMSAFDGGKIIEETENLNLLAFCVFAAIESKNTSVLSYIKEQRPHAFIPALKIAVERARVAKREGFFDILFSPPFKKHLTSEALASLILSPHDPNLSLFVLNQMDIGFFKKEHIMAAVKSAVCWADYSDLTANYLTALLKSAHNSCEGADDVQIFVDSCAKGSADHVKGLKALLNRLSDQDVTNVFCSLTKMSPATIQKVLPIIFEVRGHNMDIEAVVQFMNQQSDLLLSTALNTPIWNRIPHPAPNGDVAVALA